MRLPFRLPLGAPDVKIPAERDSRLEALRACAALFVLCGHVFAHVGEWPWLTYLGAGRGGVLLFFTISGYVIGLSNQQTWSQSSRGDYWRRRFIRLGPLYFLVVVFSLALAWLVSGGLSPAMIGANLLCLQNFNAYGPCLLPPVPTNNALWTLNYEVVFYAAFLIVWKWRPSCGAAVGTCLVIGVAACALPPLYFLGGYAAGFVFWLAGLMLAWLVPPRPTSRDTADHPPFLGLLLLLIGTCHAAPGKVLLAFLGVPLERLPFVSPADFAFLPVCLLLIGAATRRLPSPSGGTRLACILLPMLTLVAAVATGHSLMEPRWAAATVTTLAGSFLIWFNIGDSLLGRLAPLGALSYALYLCHQPLQHMLRHVLPGREIAAATLTLALVFPLAWLLERRLQPFFAGRRAGQP